MFGAPDICGNAWYSLRFVSRYLFKEHPLPLRKGSWLVFLQEFLVVESTKSLYILKVKLWNLTDQKYNLEKKTKLFTVLS